MYESLSLITVNLAKGAKLREEKKNGVEYLIAPVAMLVPGVLEGANSPPTLYPVDLVANTAERWNKSVLVLNHPRNKQHQFISVNSSEYSGDTEIGFVDNCAYEENKLRGEAWIDVEKLKKLDTKLLNSIKARDKIELSTGLLSNVKSEQGEFNGKKYTQRLVDFIPDHLAILNDTQGACSIYDGCGVHANESPIDNESKIVVEDEGMKRSLIKMFKALLGVKEKEVESSDETETEISTNTINKGDTNVCTKDELIASVIANSEHFTEADKPILNQMDEPRLKELETSAKKTKEILTNAATLAANEKKKKEEEEAAAKKKEEEEMQTNTQKPLTEEEWLKSAPESVQAAFNHSKQLVANAKAELVSKLTRHIKDETKKQERIVALQSKSLEDLQDRVKDLPEQPEFNQAPPQGLFFGAVGGNPITANQGAATKEVLDIPTVDWSKENRFAKAGK